MFASLFGQKQGQQQPSNPPPQSTALQVGLQQGGGAAVNGTQQSMRVTAPGFRGALTHSHSTVGATKKQVRRNDVDIAFVVDTSGSMAGSAIERVMQAARDEIFSGFMKDHDRCAVITFQRVQQGWTTKKEMRDASALTTPQCTGGTPLLDATMRGMQLLQDRGSRNVPILLVITDGHENCSTTYGGASGWAKVKAALQKPSSAGFKGFKHFYAFFLTCGTTVREIDEMCTAPHIKVMKPDITSKEFRANLHHIMRKIEEVAAMDIHTVTIEIAQERGAAVPPEVLQGLQQIGMGGALQQLCGAGSTADAAPLAICAGGSGSQAVPCQYCKKTNHTSENCFFRPGAPQRRSNEHRTPAHQPQQPQQQRNMIKCYCCQGFGHMAKDCPSSARPRHP